MKIKYTVAVSMLAGMAIGVFVIQGLHAQAKPHVYMIALNEVTVAKIAQEGNTAFRLRNVGQPRG